MNDEQSLPVVGESDADLPDETTSSLVDDILSGVSDILSGALADPELSEDEVSVSPPPQVVVIQNETVTSPFEGEEVLDEDSDTLVYDDEYGIQAYALNPITSASGLKGVLLDVLGDYDAIVVEYRYQNNNSSTYSYVREIQPDFPWLCSAGIFLALLWSVFTIGGRLICRK